ncbi:hypothetical protein C8Q70DRAFT_1059251 [Cubamyces menziesii]|nr:hypothetical protein C8Q70DRAFT_1059251 [Cubamyces menziesii]
MDIMQREGKYPLPPGAPEILGVEFSGHVVKAGEGVSEWKEGDEVLGLASGGAYAEYMVVPHRNVIRKPDNLSWIEAATFQALVVLAEVKKGDHVLVHAGASGVGIAVIQLARLYGATTDFAEEVKKITNGKGVDVIIDVVGQSHWHKNIDSLAFDGRMTLLATLSGDEVSKFSLRPILYKRLRIQGSTLRARSEDYQAQLIARFKQEALHHITGSSGDGQIRTYIHKVYPWTEIQDAHREMEANSNSGKIVVEVV